MRRFKNILCVVISEQAYKPALQRAVALAEQNQARLTVVDVIEPVSLASNLPYEGLSREDFQAALLRFHDKRLATLLAPYREHFEIQHRVLEGPLFLAIIREVLRHHYDLVIKVTETQDWLTRLFGSDDMHLLRKCPSPVWLIKPTSPPSYQHILAAIDVEDDDSAPAKKAEQQHALSKQILQMASALALSNSAKLSIVHVWEAFGEGVMRGGLISTPQEKVNAYIEQVRRQHQTRVDQLIAEMATNVGVDSMKRLKPQLNLLKGGARREIPLLAKNIDADLLVMGTVARTGIPGFIMGNTAESILNQIDCSVIAIKPSGFVSPVTLEGNG
ncbi:Universal stress protein family 1 [hydrothermal vent metagenome]|uniref:Universal stress protein family 1 n=1 Tax=hydrothermal vent metagenome TaxID=652676 RepID=A0A3B1B779_9ZZZZ